MAGMALADLVTELKATLHDAGNAFTAPGNADFQRFLEAALPDMGAKRPLTRKAEVTLTVGEARYAVPVSDFAAYKTDRWWNAASLPKPWEQGWPGSAPRVTGAWDGGVWWLVFDPAPTGQQVALFGSLFSFWYFGRHVLGADSAATTVHTSDKGLLLLRAQAEAMRELSIRGSTKPVSLRDGLSGTPRNSTPAALHEALMRQFSEAR